MKARIEIIAVFEDLKVIRVMLAERIEEIVPQALEYA